TSRLATSPYGPACRPHIAPQLSMRAASSSTRSRRACRSGNASITSMAYRAGCIRTARRLRAEPDCADARQQPLQPGEVLLIVAAQQMDQAARRHRNAIEFGGPHALLRGQVRNQIERHGAGAAK